ncbi:MAG: hypothetical protein EZS28_055952, partial [Streblomastix strix]
CHRSSSVFRLESVFLFIEGLNLLLQLKRLGYVQSQMALLQSFSMFNWVSLSGMYDSTVSLGPTKLVLLFISQENQIQQQIHSRDCADRETIH